MELLTDELKRRLPKLKSTGLHKELILKFTDNRGEWSWYVIEGEEDSKTHDWIFYGLMEGQQRSLGHFTLREIESITINGESLIRDKKFKPKLLSGGDYHNNTKRQNSD